MNTYQCIIVEDEPLAQNILKKYIQEVPFLELKSCCDNAYEAMDALRKGTIDIMFLDVNMPGLSGVGLLKTIVNPKPMVIITSAYSEYALDGYDYDIVDFLLKPFLFERFLKAVNKTVKLLEEPNKNTSVNQEVDQLSKTLIIKVDKKNYRILESDILLLESIGNYVKIHTKEKNITTHTTLQNIHKELSQSFVRIHKSYVVAISVIEYIEGNSLVTSKGRYPIGETYKASVKKILL